MERKRKRLLALIAVSGLLILGILIIEFYVNIPALTLFLLIPISFYIAFLLYRVQQFRITFKPKVVNLILDFIDDGLNIGTLSYDPKKKVDLKTFMASGIFRIRPAVYQGEDHISGKIGELDFEMSEIEVREMSKVRNRLNYVFRGVFLHAKFVKPRRGAIMILPRAFNQYLTKTIKDFNLRGGKPLGEPQLSRRFNRNFITYATPQAFTNVLLSDEMQHAIVDYKERTGKEIYISFLVNDMYLAVTEPRDMLEPKIFQSNLSYALIREFFEDIQLLVTIVQDIDDNE